MKTICWNRGFILKAENGQDALYLTEYIKELEYKDMLSGWIELKCGEFDSDNNLEKTETMFLSEINKKTVWTTDVVEIKFSQYCDWSTGDIKKMANKIK